MTLRSTVLPFALVLVLPGVLVAQQGGGARLTCQRARAELRAELARAAAVAPKGRWTPERASETSDGATITAAQQTLYARARAALDSAGPMLDSLSALHADVDEAALEQARPRLRERLQEVMEELGRADGPRPRTLDGVLRDAAELVGRLGLVLCRPGAVSAELEARTLASFARLEHAVSAARRDWIAAGSPRRPTQVAQQGVTGETALVGAPINVAGVTDSLDAVMQSLDSIAGALDASQLAPEQRDSVMVTSPGSARMTLTELLARVEHYAAEDAPRVLEAGGADALPTLSAAADTLRQLVRGMRLPASVAQIGEESGPQQMLERLARRLDGLYSLLASPSRE
jgi:hypothetical protein